MKTHTVLAIGAHVGDAELTAGALLATCAVHGGKAVTLALTAGEKGAPAGADIAAYRRDKIAQAEAFAKDLGGEAIVLPYEDGLVPDNDEIRFAVCDVIRQVKPDIIVTHHANSMHKDHAACHRIVADAWFYAAIEGFQRELPKHFAKKLYFAENWEDADGFKPYYYFDVTEAFPVWKEAIKELWLAEHSTSIKYLRYYEALSVVRGAKIRVDHATCFGIEDYAKRQILDRL